MNDPMYTDFQRRCAAVLYYLASDVPAGVWRTAEGVDLKIRDMSIEQLDRYVARVRDDLKVLGYPICQDRYGEMFTKPARAKLAELLNVRESMLMMSTA
jgi:hypothetical protein